MKFSFISLINFLDIFLIYHVQGTAAMYKNSRDLLLSLPQLSHKLFESGMNQFLHQFCNNKYTKKTNDLQVISVIIW